MRDLPRKTKKICRVHRIWGLGYWILQHFAQLSGRIKDTIDEDEQFYSIHATEQFAEQNETDYFTSTSLKWTASPSIYSPAACSHRLNLLLSSSSASYLKCTDVTWRIYSFFPFCDDLEFHTHQPTSHSPLSICSSNKGKRNMEAWGTFAVHNRHLCLFFGNLCFWYLAQEEPSSPQLRNTPWQQKIEEKK